MITFLITNHYLQDSCELVTIAQSHDHLHVKFIFYVLMMMVIIVILIVMLKFELTNNTK